MKYRSVFYVLKTIKLEYKSPQHLFDMLLKKILEYNPDSDTELIRKAYLFAKKAHEWQVRKSWELYINHPINTAINLTKLWADDVSIVSALLHDVPEDTKYTIEEVNELFWGDVAKIVNWVTKLSKVHYKEDMKKREVESQRKMLVNIWKDIRVIFVKICDRLHNIKTLHNLPENKRKRIAIETLEIYIPIVKLMAIGEFVWELEDICFKYAFEDEYKNIYNIFWQKYNYYVEKIVTIESVVIPHLKNVCNNLKFSWRIKWLYSIYKKMRNKKLILSEIYDIIALRIIVKTNKQCYQALWVIHSIFRAKQDRIKDYISIPKNNWYQSLHTTVFDFDGDMIEFQIVSEKMHSLNKYWIASHFVYKIANSKYNHIPSWIKNVLEIQKWEIDSDIFIDKLKKEVLWSTIQCYTINWDQIELPNNSTLLDFAYAINKTHWDRIKHAYVNWVYVTNPVHILKKWDVINIIKWISKNTNFPIEYLSIVKTNTALENMKKIVKTYKIEKRRIFGKFLLNKRLDSYWFRHFDNLPTKIQNDIFKKFFSKDKNQFYDNIWWLDIDPNLIINYLSKIYRKSSTIKNVSLKIYLKMIDYKTLWPIIEVFNSLKIHIKSLKYWNDYFTVVFYIEKFIQFENLLLELNRVPNVRDIKRMYPFTLILLYTFSVSALVFVISNPVLIQYISIFQNSQWKNNTLNIIFSLTFLILVFMIYLLKYVIKITLPDSFNHKFFWLNMFLINTIILLTIFRYLLFLEFNFYGIVFFWMWILIYMILINEFKDYKLEQTFAFK